MKCQRNHRAHILTTDLRQAYDYLVEVGESDESFDVSENKPARQNRKRAVDYHYAGKRAYPFAFIINSGERKDYHLFYIRRPNKGDMEIVKGAFSEDLVSENNRSEITIQIHDLDAAKKVWKIVKKIQLQ